MASRPLLVDTHTHVYPPSYMDLMRKRTTIPRVSKAPDGSERVILLKEEESSDNSSSKGRPVGPQYFDRDEKLAFMDVHGIDVSVVSLANPWLDFLTPAEAVDAAKALNEDLNEYCSTYKPEEASPSIVPSFKALTSKRLYAFGSLPLVPGISTEQVVESIEQIKGLSHLKGVVMGTKGIGKGLDDPEMEKIWVALDAAGLVSFVHPHYGIEGAFGELDNGHVLPLALGFPFETSIAIARLILAGILDRIPTLQLLIAHSAGALPALSSRLSSCIMHDPHVKDRLQHDFRYYLGKLWFDAVCYGPEELSFVERTIARADNYEGKEESVPFVDRVRDRADLTAPEGVFSGASRIMFGTDHPFFPPVGQSPALTTDPARWKSVDENLTAIAGAAGWSEEDKSKVMGGNAVALFSLDL